jgi:hypothetical protein
MDGIREGEEDRNSSGPLRTRGNSGGVTLMAGQRRDAKSVAFAYYGILIRNHCQSNQQEESYHCPQFADPQTPLCPTEGF